MGKIYYLGDKHPKIYFTLREAYCMACFIKNLSDIDIEHILDMSSRTISYYRTNLMAKLNCVSKEELVTKVLDSDFVKNIDFEI